MQSLKHDVPNLIFGIYCWEKFPDIECLKSNYSWFELQADNEVGNRFWIDDAASLNVLIIEVAIDQSLQLSQVYLDRWRSYNCPIIWIINDDISYQSLSHPIYRQLLKKVSPAGECILNHSAVSEYSVTAIAKNLLSRSLSQS